MEFQALAVTAQAVKEHLGKVFGRDRVVVYDKMSVINGELNENEIKAMVCAPLVSSPVVCSTGARKCLAVLAMISLAALSGIFT